MSYLSQYKAGSAFFRTLCEGRMRWHALRNAIRYNYSPPDSIVGLHDYLAEHGDSCLYEKRSESRPFHFPETSIQPESARLLLEKKRQIYFPEAFVLRIPNGRVFGDGTVIGEGNCILSETTIDFHRKQEHHRLLRARKIPAPERFEGRLAVIASPGSDNYFHWTLDSVPRCGLLKQTVEDIDAFYVNDRSPFHREWLGMLGIPEEKIFPAASDRHVHAAELIVPSFAGKAGLPSPEGTDFIRNFMPEASQEGAKRIFISRADARRRRILNEDDLLPILKRHGFALRHPGRMNVAAQMNMFSSARVVAAPHGAELTNLVYCSPGARVVELFSPRYLNACFKQLAAVRGLEHYSLVGKGGARLLRRQTDVHHVWANIRTPEVLLDQTLKALVSDLP